MKPGFIEVERLILDGDVTGATTILENICKEDPVAYRPVKDRFLAYVVKRNLEKDVLIKKNKTASREEIRKQWYALFKN